MAAPWSQTTGADELLLYLILAHLFIESFYRSTHVQVYIFLGLSYIFVSFYVRLITRTIILLYVSSHWHILYNVYM